MAKRKTYSQEVPAFVGIDRRGNFAWGTIRPTREGCLEVIERFGGAVNGFPDRLRIMPVFIGYDLNRQLAFQLGDDQPQPTDPDSGTKIRLTVNSLPCQTINNPAC